MILRKPYALFIKNFRLIHIILAFLTGYLLVRTSELLGFFNDFLSSSLTTIGAGASTSYFNSYLFIVPILIALLSMLILSLMAFKNKPVLFYLINTAIAIYLVVIYSFAQSNMLILELRAVDVRVLRAIRDLLAGGMLLGMYSFIITFIRATGFDIRKFNFGQDLEEMAVNEADREEFEVEVSFDPDKLKSKYRRFMRNLRYTYFENKFLTDIALSSIAVIFIFILLLNAYVFNKTYNQNNYFSSLGIMMKITNSYVTTKDYYGNTIDKDKVFVILKAEVKSIGGTRLLSTSNMDLKIGNIIYKTSKSYNDKFIDLGDPYIRQDITNNPNQYIFVYEISKSHMNRAMTFRYNASVGVNEKYIPVALKPNYLDIDVISKTLAMKETIDFKDSILKNSKLNLSQFDMAGTYLVSYNYCASTSDCYLAYEYLAPSIGGNDDKAIIGLYLDYTVDESLNVPSIATTKGLIETYGHIRYKDELGNIVEQKYPFKSVELSKAIEKGKYFFEISAGASYSTEAQLVIKVRNYEYIYNLAYTY